jgi:prepilin-type N-terminal cleavage/methylation domain-containing protein/prepilin-type processing-associated H-X9-DG protein
MFVPSRRAFTLVELLIVIGIIVILIALLLPAIGSIRARSRSVQCASNQRQVWMAYNVARENRPAGVSAADWPVEVLPFVSGDEEGIFHCPEDLDRGGASSFGLNHRAARLGPKDLQGIVLLDYNDVTARIVGRSLQQLNAEWPALHAARHMGQINVVFHDGSGASKYPDDIDPRYCDYYRIYWWPDRDTGMELDGCLDLTATAMGGTTGSGSGGSGGSGTGGMSGGSDGDSTNGGTGGGTDGSTDGSTGGSGGGTTGPDDPPDPPCSSIDWVGGKTVRMEEFPPSLVHNNFQDDDTVYLFTEHCGMVLPQNVSVDLSPLDPPDQQIWKENLGFATSPATIPAGTVVDVYLVHFDPIKGGRTNVTAELQFNRPILGMIITNAKMLATDALLGNVDTRYSPTKARSFDQREEVYLSADMKNVELFLTTTTAMEQARIIVAGGYE